MNQNKIKLLGFRWWCHLTEKMIYVDFSDILHNEHLPHPSSCDFSPMRPVFVCEDGKIVYEGDILLWEEYQGWEDGRTFQGYYVVVWDNDEQHFLYYDPFSNEYFDPKDTHYSDVVGNIFENKHLLPEGYAQKFLKNY